MSKTEGSNKAKNKHIFSRLGGLAIMLGVAVILVIFGYFYLQKVTQREKMAGFLPADRTVAMIEFNLENNREDVRTLQGALQQNAYIKMASASLSSLVPNPQQFEKWYSGRGGLAVISTPNGQDFSTALFLAVSDAGQVGEWLNSMLLDPKADAVLDEDYFGQKLISFKRGQTVQILWAKDYLIFSEDRELLENVAQTVAGRQLALRSLPVYNQIFSALPEQNIGFIYLDRSKLLSVLSKNDRFLSGRMAVFKLYFPFLNLLGSEGIAVRLERDDQNNPVLLAKHLSMFNQSVLPDQALFETSYFYSGKLEKLLPGEHLLLAGGVNLLDQKNKLYSYLNNGSSINDLLMGGMESSLSDALSSGSSKVSLDADFFPVFQKEYLFFAGSGAAGLADFGLLAETEHPQNDLLKMQKVILAVGPKIAAQLLAKPVPMTLPDGTTGSEMKAELTGPLVSTKNYDGNQIEQIEFAPQFSLYLAADEKNQYLAVSSSLPALRGILQNVESSANRPMEYSLNRPTETYYLDLQKLLTLVPGLSEPINPLKYLKVARKFTEIGILSTYQFGL